MKFKADTEYLFVEGIQFKKGLFETTNSKEIEIMERYKDRVSVVLDEEKPSKAINKAKSE